MKLNASEINSLFNKYYCMKKDYDYLNDPDFTYQELILGYNAYYWNTYQDNILDTDNLKSAENVWNKCIAHLFKPMICDKEWDKILVDRSHTSKPNLNFDENDMPIYWYQTPEYKDIYEKEEKGRNNKDKIEFENWIKKKEKQRNYQSKRRAIIKEKKENGIK